MPFLPTSFAFTLLSWTSSATDAFAGAFLGAYIVDYFITKDSIRALHSGVGALIGKVGGLFAKGFITVAMIVISLVSIIKN